MDLGLIFLSKKIGDTKFALSAIPLGGYVEIAGSAEMGQGEQKDAARNKTLILLPLNPIGKNSWFCLAASFLILFLPILHLFFFL